MIKQGCINGGGFNNLLWPLFVQALQTQIYKRNGSIIEKNDEGISLLFFGINKSQKLSQFCLSAINKNTEFIIVVEKEIEQNFVKKNELNLLTQINKYNFNAQCKTKIISAVSNNILKVQQNISKDFIAKIYETQLTIFILNTIESLIEFIGGFIRQIENYKKPVQKTKSPMKVNEKFYLQMIALLKNSIIGDIGSREKSNLYKSKQSTAVSDLMNLNPYLFEEDKSYQSEKMNLKNLNQAEQSVIKNQCKQTEGDKAKISKKIVQKIKIINKKVDRSWKSRDSNFGILTKFLALYKIQKISFNQQANELANSQPQQSEQTQKIQQEFLIQKMPKTEDKKQIQKKSLNCFNTEIVLLKYLRNFSNNFVASYYMESLEEASQKTAIYLQFYERPFQPQKLNFKDSIKCMRMLSEVLKFFHQFSILHRDLKPDNIMLASPTKIKVIDFGSSWINCKHINYQICPKLFTTFKYNPTYGLLMEKHEITQQQFQQHEFYDVYSFGCLLRMIIDRPSEGLTMQNSIKIHLKWLSSCCMEINPYNRASPIGIALFMKHIHQLIQFLNKKKI